MKKLAALAALALLCFGSDSLRSQSADSKSPLEVLTQMRDANKDLISTQEKTLQALDDLQKQAEQLRVFGKRT